MSKVHAWSKALIVGCTIVASYSALVMASLHVHHHHGHHGDHHHGGPEGEGHHGHHHPPCPLMHFAMLTFATSITGIIAACTAKRSWLIAFPIILMATEMCALVHISRGAAHAVQHCTEVSTHVDRQLVVERAQVLPGLVMERAHVSESAPYVDLNERADCIDGVRHAVVMSCLIVGIICSALMCCGSKMLVAVDAEAEQAAASSSDSDSVAVERVPLTKADPLAADDDDELVAGKVRLV